MTYKDHMGSQIYQISLSSIHENNLYVISHRMAVNHVMNRQTDNFTDNILIQNIKIMSIDLLSVTNVADIYIILVMVRYP